MEYTVINGKKVSRISLGTVQLGLNYGIANNSGKPREEQSLEILSTALNCGITAIDTASTYGNSEKIIGEFLQGYDGEFPFITTKFKLKAAPDATYTQVKGELERTLSSSLRNLKIDYVDCLLVHNPADIVAHPDSLPAALEEVKKQGLAKVVGISIANPADVESFTKVRGLYGAVQLPANILDRRLIESGDIELLDESGINVFVRSVFFQGVLFLDESKLCSTGLKSLVGGQLSELKDLADAENMSVAQFALSYIRDTKGVKSLVLGADNAYQVKENIQLFNTPSISDTTLQELKRRLRPIDILRVMQILSVPKSNKA